MDIYSVDSVLDYEKIKSLKFKIKQHRDCLISFYYNQLYLF